MKTQHKSSRSLFITTVTLAWIAMAPIGAHESEHKITVPGFRPPTEAASAFVQHAGSSTIAVFPSIIRTVKPAEDQIVQEHSSVALDGVVEFLKENSLGNGVKTDFELEIGEASKGGQFAVFNETIQVIGRQLERYEGDADYVLVLDIIRVNTRAWGIQSYLLNRSGENVFSFLLNSHHQALVDADIHIEDESAENQEKFITECIELALESLKAQVEMERDIAAYKLDPAHVGRYVDEEEDPAENYIELKSDGSFSIKDDGQAMEGRYAVVKGNRLVLILPEQGLLPVGRLENGQLHTSDGRTAKKTAPDSSR